MTDDFQLFADPDDGARPIDPDIALLSAYLARELSPLQVLAVEERLTTDAEFRAAMQPLIDLWAAPVASLEGAAHQVPPLTAREQEEGWQRFVAEDATASSITQSSIAQDIQGRVSMKRIAAVIGLAILPMVSFAQVVVYAANNADVRGHTIARRIVAPFVDETQAPKPRPQPRRAKVSPPGSLASQPDAATTLPIIVAPSIGDAGSMMEQQRAEPNRARIAELARTHQGAVVRGEIAAEYVVMVLDAADQYVWSTAGTGNLSIEVAGDPRTPNERLAWNRAHSADFRGTTGAGGRGGGGRVLLRVDGRDSVVTGFFARDTAAAATGGRGRGAGAGDSTLRYSLRLREARILDSTNSTTRPLLVIDGVRVDSDSLYRLQYERRLVEQRRVAGGRGAGSGVADTAGVQRRIEFSRPDASGRGAAAGGRGGGGGRSISFFDSASVAGDKPGTYRNGWSATRNGSLVNQAEGLTELTPGQSGIEGLPSASVASADTYVFAAGELAPAQLRVMVVHLVAGTRWGR